LDAIKYARRQIKSARPQPISIRLLNEAHRRLMRGLPTHPRNTAFIPAPPEQLPALLADLEKYLHEKNGLPPLILIGLEHAQFEAIHPYRDGNGRIGRLLITLLLEQWNLTSAPLLYLSLFFKRHRAEYYQLLDEVRTSGDWQAWIAFFLEGVATIADEAVIAAREISALISADRQRLIETRGASVMAIRLMDRLPTRPVVTIPTAANLLKTTKPTAGKAIRRLEKIGVLIETSGKIRGRTFAYAGYKAPRRDGHFMSSSRSASSGPCIGDQCPVMMVIWPDSGLFFLPTPAFIR